MTKTTLPPASAIEKTIAENKTCVQLIGEQQECGKRRISCDVAFYQGQWVVFFTCEDSHKWYDPIREPDDSRTNVGP